MAALPQGTKINLNLPNLTPAHAGPLTVLLNAAAAAGMTIHVTFDTGTAQGTGVYVPLEQASSP